MHKMLASSLHQNHAYDCRSNRVTSRSTGKLLQAYVALQDMYTHNIVEDHILVQVLERKQWIQGIVIVPESVFRAYIEVFVQLELMNEKHLKAKMKAMKATMSRAEYKIAKKAVQRSVARSNPLGRPL